MRRVLAGEKYTDIARELGVSVRTVTRIAREAGVAPRSEYWNCNKAKWDAKLAEIQTRQGFALFRGGTR